MLKLFRFLTILMIGLAWGVPEDVCAQSNLRYKTLIVSSDTLVLDSLSLIPGSLVILHRGEVLDSTSYQIDAAAGKIVFNPRPADTLRISYRVFPVNFTQPRAHKDRKKLEPDLQGNRNPFSYTPADGINDIFFTEGLTKSGSISRGVSFGNSQDLAVNSNLSLQLSGKISDKLHVLASVTDDNIPIQPDGNTQQLQDFDQVFIKVYDDRSSLIAGDFWMKKPQGYFLNYNKRVQGGSFSSTIGSWQDKDSSKGFLETRISGAVSKGKFARNLIQGVEGNQGPYRLTGAENETFIIVLAGTEQVYIDGQLLQRGQSNDYIIDYNSAEIIFTPNRLITKDRRIIVEFQYSDKNYARSILETSNTYYQGAWKVHLNVYSEQDNKNQPLQQELSTENKRLLASVGDSVQLAFSPRIDSVAFNDNLVLYKMIDSLGYDSVFVFSNNPDSAFYKLGFSFVGQGNGNYTQSDFTALGRTFRWVAPDTVGGEIRRRGDYEHVVLLIAPKRRQMVTAGAEYRMRSGGRLFWEGAYTYYSPNTFAPSQAHHRGYGFKGGWQQRFNLPSEKKDLALITTANAEAISATFNPVERFRAVEFERNWNVLGRPLSGNQYIGDAEIALEKRQVGRIGYGFNSFISGNDYTGVQHRLQGNYQKNRWNGQVNGSLLQSSGFEKSSFLRHKAALSYATRYITFGFRDEHEYNRFYAEGSDTLGARSYRFYDWEIYAQNADTSRNRYNIFYRRRIDWLPFNRELPEATKADHYGFSFELLKNSRSQLRGKAAYRNLQITDPQLTAQQPDRTILSRLEYDLRLFRTAITSSTFYEIGTGQELKREFIYIEVPAGQGMYTWIDYNGNGIKELNEFEIAAFPDQATYIRTFTPTNEYVRTYTNQFSQTLTLNPASIWRNKKGVRKVLALFSNQSAYRIDRKTNSENELNRFNPFLLEIADSSLISMNSSLRNTLFFNRNEGSFGGDYTYQDVRGKSLLTSGFESRTNHFHLLRIRWNIHSLIGLITEGEQGVKANASDFLAGRNYTIGYHSIRPKINFQPGTTFRLSVLYNYSEKYNDPELGGEKAFISDLGIEMRYSEINKGSLLANFNYIQIAYTGLQNTALAFEMLNALRTGTNFTWSASYQRNLSNNLQLSLNYNGRKSEEVKAIHSGGVQVRAFF